ncbi:glutathione S-transferase family protein [Alteromonas sp. ASW11-36]|uniref:Glutathione S-transferase family protein n=1 Tax=Alteromonas arenosi TaxID=3055817 RepID=A0ABT7SVR9_9ALTE|nr:glutathione S-transferase family protein [Alteromonas sp. ASW11-36]MDM7860271.1 glutathione S-transferase family protein [Alteromonas sp. ASW11-36]
MFTVYGDKRSGNCYKIQLTCALLDLNYDWIDVDIMHGESQSAAFKQLSPAAKIPIVKFADGRVLSESNAICNFLAYDSPLYPVDKFTQAAIQQWQFYEQYSHEPNIAVARFIKLYQGLPDNRQAEYENKVVGSYKALEVMEKALQQMPFFAGENLTTADISLFAYTHKADEGGISLADFPNVEAWIERVQSSPNFVTMDY